MSNETRSNLWSYAIKRHFEDLKATARRKMAPEVAFNLVSLMFLAYYHKFLPISGATRVASVSYGEPRFLFPYLCLGSPLDTEPGDRIEERSMNGFLGLLSWPLDGHVIKRRPTRGIHSSIDRSSIMIMSVYWVSIGYRNLTVDTNGGIDGDSQEPFYP